MLDDLFDFWKRDLGSWRLIFRFMRRTLLLILVELVCVVILISIIEPPLLKEAISLLALFFSFRILLRSARRVLSRHHGVPPKSSLDYPRALRDLKKRLFLAELTRKGIDLSRDSEKLISVVQDRAEGAKLSDIVKLSSLSVFLIPVWSQVLSWIYTHEVKDWPGCVRISLELIGLVLLFWSSGIQLAAILGSMINVDFFRYKELEAVLKELAFESGVLIRKND